MKLFLLALMIFCGGLRAAVAAETAASPDPLERQIANSYSYKSFDDFMGQIREKTGFKVTYPEAVADLYREGDRQLSGTKRFDGSGPACMEWIGFNRDAENEKDGMPRTVSIKEWMTQVCGFMHLGWKFDPDKQVLALDIPWKKSDPRSAMELMDYVCKRQGDDREWRTAFDALLSKDVNIAKSYRVRQRASRMFAGNKIILAGGISAASKTRYTFIMIHHPSFVMPGCNLASYYWFKRDGSLAGAGLMGMSTGTYILDALVEDTKSAHDIDPSEVQIIYKGTFEGGYTIARFVLEDTGLKLTHLTNARGEEIPDRWGIGRSYLPPEGK